MSALSDDARAVVLIADHIAMEAKIHALGLGFTAAVLQGNGFTAPQSVLSLIDFPSKYAGQEFALTIELRDDETDTAVQVPTATGQPEAMRIQRMTRINPPVVPPPMYVPPTMFCRVQTVLAFSDGLPLQAGRFYHWHLEIDGQHRDEWAASFYVLGPPPAPVFGGPVGPADIGLPPINPA